MTATWTTQQAIDSLLHMNVRLARLVAITYLWLTLITIFVLLNLTAWWWTNLRTLQSLHGEVPAWLVGFVTLGGIVSVAAVVHKAYHLLAGKFLSHYVTRGLTGDR